MLLITESDSFLQAHGIDLYKDIIVPSLGIDKIIQIVALVYAVKTFASSHRLSKITFQHELIKSHREIWNKIIADPSLKKINDSSASITDITPEIKRCVIFLILNTKIAYDAFGAGVYEYHEKGRMNSGTFFNLPIPSFVWDEVKTHYAEDFVLFIDIWRQKANGTFRPPISFRVRVTIFCQKCINWIVELYFRLTVDLKTRLLSSYQKVTDWIRNFYS